MEMGSVEASLGPVGSAGTRQLAKYRLSLILYDFLSLGIARTIMFPASLCTLPALFFKFTVDCQQPHDDNILEPKELEKFYTNRITVAGKTGNLGEKVAIARDTAKNHGTSEAPFAKHHLKCLQQLRDFLRAVAPNKSSHELRYFNINEGSNIV